MTEITLILPKVFVILTRGFDIKKLNEFLFEENFRQCKKKKNNKTKHLRIIKSWEDHHLGL